MCSYVNKRWQPVQINTKILQSGNRISDSYGFGAK